MTKYAISIDNVYQKYKKGIRLPVLRGYTMLANVPFSTIFVYLIFEFVLHMSFGLPGPLRTAFEPKN